MSYRAEYIWIDGTQPTAQLRSKTKILSDGAEPGTCGFDGSSTNQAPGPGSDYVLRYLLAAGAAPQPEDRWGGTPLSDAEGNGHTEIAALLREHAQPVVPPSRHSGRREAAAV
jgi:hypothetical protein